MSQHQDSYLGLFPHRSTPFSELSTGDGLTEDDGFEVFDPHGLFSPRRRLSADDARLNHDQLSSLSQSKSQSHSLNHSLSPLPSSSTSSPFPSPPISPRPAHHLLQHSYQQHDHQTQSSSRLADRPPSDLTSPFLPSFLLPSGRLPRCHIQAGIESDVSDHGYIQIDSHPCPIDSRFQNSDVDTPADQLPIRTDFKPLSPFDSPLSPCSLNGTFAR